MRNKKRLRTFLAEGYNNICILNWMFVVMYVHLTTHKKNADRIAGDRI